MPHESTGYMQALDGWTQDVILDPLYQAWRDVETAPEEAQEDLQADLIEVVASVKRAIREKVLESYRNGQKALQRSPAVSRPQGNSATLQRRRSAA